jgi:hypothetical protein
MTALHIAGSGFESRLGRLAEQQIYSAKLSLIGINRYWYSTGRYTSLLNLK